jgi:hypothetical protein
VGISFLLNLSVKQVAGIASLGIAATWLVGGVNLRKLRAISAVACLAALGILIPVAWSDWRAYREWTSSLAGLPPGAVPIGFSVWNVIIVFSPSSEAQRCWFWAFRELSELCEKNGRTQLDLVGRTMLPQRISGTAARSVNFRLPPALPSSCISFAERSRRSLRRSMMGWSSPV